MNVHTSGNECKTSFMKDFIVTRNYHTEKYEKFKVTIVAIVLHRTTLKKQILD